MKYKGLIFDFNGTLLWDTHLHNQAWDLFLRKHNILLTDQQKNEKIHGKNNRDIFSGLFNREIEASQLENLIDEKESLYRKLVINQDMHLAPGAITLFDQLKNKQVPFTIATASGKDNLRFYFQRYELSRWFNFEQVVYDDGTLRGKPNPDFFKKAMQKLQIKPEESIVFEDSLAGIKAAENAKAGKIIIINSETNDYNCFDYDIIENFDKVDRNLWS